jgi:hypothetical protein
LRVQDIVIGRRDGFFRRGFRRFIFFREAMIVSFVYMIIYRKDAKDAKKISGLSNP